MPEVNLMQKRPDVSTYDLLDPKHALSFIRLKDDSWPGELILYLATVLSF